jgi:hypothetical protein
MRRAEIVQEGVQRGGTLDSLACDHLEQRLIG